MEIADLGIHAVALTNAIEPRAGIEPLGVGASAPEIDPTRPAIIGIDELLAEQYRHIAEAGCDLVEMRGACGLVDTRWQPILNNCGDHDVVLQMINSPADAAAGSSRR